ncbi:50S ribosomal protein L31 [Candidatus Poribacteria bacterium]
MKPEIHPEFKETTIACACGAIFKTMAAKEDMKVEICSKCHPFFTGKRKIVDTAGRVEKFRRKYNLVDEPEEAEEAEAAEESEKAEG